VPVLKDNDVPHIELEQTATRDSFFISAYSSHGVVVMLIRGASTAVGPITMNAVWPKTSFEVSRRRSTTS